MMPVMTALRHVRAWSRASILQPASTVLLCLWTLACGSGGESGGADGAGGTTVSAGGTPSSGADAGGSSSVMSCSATLVYGNDFDDAPLGAYSTATLAADWNGPTWNNGVDEGRVEIIEGTDAYRGRSLRVHYPLGAVRPTDGGAQWKLDLNGTFEELHLSYRVRFGAEFDFVRGGKLPGLVGGSAPTGCVEDTTGFSARGMWRPGGAAVQYLYFPEKVEACGDDYPYLSGGSAVAFSKGVWHLVEHRLVMNTPGQHDGVLEAWFDGELVLAEPTFLYRLEQAAYSIDALYFSTFFGGSDATWAPTKHETIDFDEFLLCTGPITH